MSAASERFPLHSAGFGGSLRIPGSRRTPMAFRQPFGRQDIARAEFFPASTGDWPITGVGQIASAEAFGSPAVDAGVAPTGVATGEALGSPSLAASISPAGVTSGDAFGAAAIAASVAPVGIATGEALGTPTVGAGIAPAGIASDFAAGAPAVAAGVQPVGVLSAEFLGLPIVGEAPAGTTADWLNLWRRRR